MRQRKSRGRVLMEVLIAMLILGAFLAAIGDTYRQGRKVRRRVAAEEGVRRAMANRLAERRAAVASGALLPGRVPIETLPEVMPGLKGQLSTLVKDAGPGLVELELVANWTLSKHQGTERRRLLIATDGDGR